MKTINKVSNHKVLAIFILSFFIASACLAGDWPNWRGPNYNGISEESGWNANWPPEGPKVLWKNSIGIGFSNVAVSKGKVLAMGNTNNEDSVYCFDAETGKEIWKKTYSQALDPKWYEGGTLSSPVVDANKVYTVSKDGKAYCFDTETGKIVWNKDLLDELKIKRSTWGVSGSPLIIDKLAIYNIGSSGLALNKNDGSVVWQNGSGPSGYSTPLPFNNKKSIALSGEEGIFAVETQTGKQIWYHPWKTENEVIAADPLFIDENTLFVSSGYNKGCGLLKISGNTVSEVWTNKNIRNKMNGSVLWKENIYGVDEGGKLVCIDVNTGNMRWSQEGFGQGCLGIADGKLLVMAEKGNLVVAEPSTQGYKVISQAKVLDGKCWTVPVLANGRIYVRNSKGDLLCLDVKKNDSNNKSAAVDSDTLKKNWSQWQGPNRDNKSSETGLLTQWPKDGPKLLWSAEGLGNGYSTVSIADGLLYTTGIINNEGFLFAYDLQGNLKWKQSHGAEWTQNRPGTRGTPTASDGFVYVISGTGNVSCFNSKSGEKKWSADVFKEFKGEHPQWGVAESPLIIGDLLICTPGGQTATMVALDKKTGKIVWESKSIGEKSSYCTPQLVEKGNKKIIVTMTDNFIIGVDAKDGNLLWQYDCKNYQGKPKDVNPNTPVYHDGFLYVTSGYGKGGAKLKLSEDGTKIESQPWANITLDCHHGGVVLVDGFIYGSNMKGDWICLNWNDGTVKYETKSIGKGSVFYADGMLYCFGENGTVALVKASPEGFNVVSSFKTPKGDGMLWAHPVICDGRLYVRHGNALMVYDIKNQ